VPLQLRPLLVEYAHNQSLPEKPARRSDSDEPRIDSNRSA